MVRNGKGMLALILAGWALGGCELLFPFVSQVEPGTDAGSEDVTSSPGGSSHGATSLLGSTSHQGSGGTSGASLASSSGVSASLASSLHSSSTAAPGTSEEVSSSNISSGEGSSASAPASASSGPVNTTSSAQVSSAVSAPSPSSSAAVASSSLTPGSSSAPRSSSAGVSSSAGTFSRGSSSSRASSASSSSSGSSSLGIPCPNGVADCPAPPSQCVTARCTAGRCTTSNVATGNAPNQIIGDCKTAHCSGGVLSQQTNTADPPAAQDACNQGSCVSSTPTQTPRPDGTTCAFSSGRVCSAGACVACNANVDCGVDTFCLHNVCNVSHACTTQVVNVGTALPTGQTARDCHTIQCNGLGQPANNVDDLDVPVDNNLCTRDVCTNGVAANPPDTSQNGVTCAPALACNNGVCAGCTSPAQCPAPSGPCQAASCASGACGLSNLSDTTLLADPTPHDCYALYCDGAGGTHAVASNDPPVNTACTTYSCSNGSILTTRLTDTACALAGGGTGVCNSQDACVACNQALQCPGVDNECGQRTCTASTCGMNYVAMGFPSNNNTVGDCLKRVCSGAGVVSVQIDDTDVPAADGTVCTLDCSGGVQYVPASIDTACFDQGGQVCNSVGQCVRCNTVSQCPAPANECNTRACTAGNTCSAGFVSTGTVTGVQNSGYCHRDECDGAGNIVTLVDTSDVPPSDSNVCTLDACSAGGTPYPPANARTVCTGGRCDGAGVCVASLLDGDCGTASDCVSFTCTPQRTCTQNNVAAGPAPTGQTAGDCMVVECDGAGVRTTPTDPADVPVDAFQCTDNVCTGNVPSNPFSAMGTPCTENLGVQCDGFGVCGP